MNTIFFQAIFLVIGFAILIFGADGLVKGASSLALRFGLPPLFVGLTIVAIGTSAPELVVSLSSAMYGKGDVSVGNVVGSNIFNIAVILGLTALITPIQVHRSLIRLDIPVMIAVSVTAALLINLTPVSRIAGGILFCLLLCYFAITFRAASKEKDADTGDEPITLIPLSRSLLFIGAGLAMLVFGSHLVVSAATKIAQIFNLSEAVIAITIVGLGTSIPELATSIVAALKKQPEMAIGNVVGSNIFNILGVLGISSLVTPQSSPGVSNIDWAVMVCFAIFLLPLAHTDRTLDRKEGAFLLAGYVAYIWWLVYSI